MSETDELPRFFYARVTTDRFSFSKRDGSRRWNLERNRGDSRKGSHHSPEGHRINSIPRRVRESVPRKYEIGEHKFVRIYDRPRTNVSTSGRVLPVLRPPSTSESISQVLHPPPPRQTNFRPSNTRPKLSSKRTFHRSFFFFFFFFFIDLYLSCTFSTL